MNEKSTTTARMALLLALMISVSPQVNAADNSTGLTGEINGTPPVVYNKNNLPERIDITRDNDIIGDNDELEINDSISLDWRFADSDNDTGDLTLPSVEWVCTDESNNKHVLATGTKNYVISPNDKSCRIGVNITPKTITGAPQENTPIEIGDISSYDDSDNIPNGPVNPHQLNIVDYIVAPNNASARMTVAADKTLKTAFTGAQMQIETDNLSDQLVWTSSDIALATVSDTGLVTFKAKGAVRITARHNEQRASIILSPKLFFTPSQQTKNWADADSFCKSQGDRLPAIEELSAGQRIRHAPGNSLWEEWGDSIQDVPHAGVVFWSSDLSSQTTGIHYNYMYLSDGHISSNNESASEGFACVID